MASWLIAFVGCIYLAVAVDLALHGQPAMAVVFAAYAVSNAGLYYATTG